MQKKAPLKQKIKAIENDISTLKDGVISGFDTVGSTFETFGKSVENVFINDVEPIGKDLYKVASSILKGTVYLIERPMQVALIGGGYLILRYFNEYKQAIAQIILYFLNNRYGSIINFLF